MEKSCKEFYYILSDIHIGANDRVNWFQKDFHEKYFSEILRYITNQKGTQDVIINGDWFDDWTFCADTLVGDSKQMVEKIISANPALFNESDDCGNFITLNDAISGNLCFINGNHDMTIRTQDINDTLKLQKPIISCGSYYAKNEIYAEHGHLYTTLNKPHEKNPNKHAPISAGYYITRVCANLCLRRLKESQTAADLRDNGVSFTKLLKKHKFLLFRIAFKRLLECRTNTFAMFCFLIAVWRSGADIYDVQGVNASLRKNRKDYFDKILEEFKFSMPDSITIRTKDAIDYMKKLTILPWSDHVLCDFNLKLDKYARKLSKKNKQRIIALGHTHLPMNILFHHQKKIYVNSGFMCPDRLNFLDSVYKMTFVEIEKELVDHKYQYIVRLKEIDQNFLISTLSKHTIIGRF